MERLAKANDKSTISADELPKSDVGGARAGSVATGGPGTEASRSRLVVHREHVRSVVKLALSEANTNAFVAINALEGLLKVMIDEEKETKEDAGMPPRANPSNCLLDGGGDETVHWPLSSDRAISLRRAGSPEKSPEKVAEMSLASGENHSRGPLTDRRRRRTPTQDASIPPVKGTVNVAYTYSAGGSSGGRGRGGLSGAALCASLGALPAVLGCLREHDGHSKIEPLGMSLLQIFAGDSTTRSEIRGNVDVAALCAARMRRVTAAGAAGTSISTVLVSAGLGRLAMPGDDSTSTEHQDINETKTDLTAMTVGTNYNCRDTEPLTPDKVSSGSGYVQPPALSTGSTSIKARSSVSSAQNETPGVPIDARRGVGKSLNLHVEERKNDHLTMIDAVSGEEDGRMPTRRTTANKDCNGASTSVRAKKPAPSAATTPASTIGTSAGSVAAKSAVVPVPPLMFVLSVALHDSPGCQRLVLQAGGIADVLGVLRGIAGRDDDPRLTESCLRILERLAGFRYDGRTQTMNAGGVEAALRSIGRFRWERTSDLLYNERFRAKGFEEEKGPNLFEHILYNH